MTAMVVTATQGGSTANGLALRIMVLTGAADIGSQPGQVLHAHPFNGLPFLTTATKSVVYGAACAGTGTYSVINASTTEIDNIADSTNGEQYMTFKTSAPTGTPGWISGGVGFGGAGNGVAAAEILVSGGSPAAEITEDSSAPPPVWTAGNTAVTSGSFDPPPGSLLVALVSSDGGGSVCTMTVEGGGLSWAEAVAENTSSYDYNGVWIAQVPPAFLGGDDDPVITATQGGSTGTGMALRVYAITGARPAAQQTGATATQNGAAAHQASITTTVTGSQVYGALLNFPTGSFTANASTTIIDNFTDNTNGGQYGTCQATAVTGTPGAVTIGASSPTGGGSCALLEVLPAAGNSLAVAPGGPPLASTLTATAVSCANFTAPYGSLLIAIVSSDGGSGVTTMSVTGGGLAWREAVKSNVSGNDYTGIWVADVPGGPAVPLQLPLDLLIELVAWRQEQLDPGPPAAGGNTWSGDTTVTTAAAVAAESLAIHTSDTTVTATATVTAAGTVVHPGDAAVTTTAAVTAAGTTVRPGAATVTTTAAVTSDGTVVRPGAAALTTTATVAAESVAIHSGAAAVSITATVSTAGSTGAAPIAGDAALSFTATVTTAGTVVRLGAAAVTTTATVTTDSVTVRLGAAAVSTTAAVAAESLAIHPGAAAPITTATVSTDGSTGAAPLTGDAALSFTAAVLAAGTAVHLGVAALTTTATVTTDGTVVHPGTATVTTTAAVVTAGLRGTPVQPLTITATVLTAGTVTRIGAAAVTAAVTISAAATPTYSAQAAAVFAATVAADGVVTGLVSYGRPGPGTGPMPHSAITGVLAASTPGATTTAHSDPGAAS